MTPVNKREISSPVPSPASKRMRNVVYEESKYWYAPGGALDSQTTETQWMDNILPEEDGLNRQVPDSEGDGFPELSPPSSPTIPATADTATLTESLATLSSVTRALELEEDVDDVDVGRASGLFILPYDGPGLETLIDDSQNHAGSDVDVGAPSVAPPASIEALPESMIASAAESYRAGRPWLPNGEIEPGESFSLWSMRMPGRRWAVLDATIDSCVANTPHNGDLPITRHAGTVTGDHFVDHPSWNSGYANTLTLDYVSQLKRDATCSITVPHNVLEQELCGLWSSLHYNLGHILPAVLRGDSELVRELLDGQSALVGHMTSLMAVQKLFQEKVDEDAVKGQRDG